MNAINKIKTVIRNPKVVIDYLFARNIKWEKSGDLKVKGYNSYDEYVGHQKKKVGLMSGDFLELGKEFGHNLEERIRIYGYAKRGMSVLCLGARLGYEVGAFINQGCFAVGVDLNPGKDNRYVVTGDFHNLVWADSSIDAVYTNSLDHSFDLEKVISEIVRVLKDGGFMFLEVCDGTEEGYKFDYYESCSWKRSSDVVDLFEKFGFMEIADFRYRKPDIGKHVVLKLKK